jgi:hypothetical protein
MKKNDCESCIFKDAGCKLGFEENSCFLFKEKKNRLFLSQYRVQEIFGLPFLTKLLTKSSGILLIFGKGRTVRCFSLREIEEEQKHEE